MQNSFSRHMCVCMCVHKILKKHTACWSGASSWLQHHHRRVCCNESGFLWCELVRWLAAGGRHDWRQRCLWRLCNGASFLFLLPGDSMFVKHGCLSICVLVFCVCVCISEGVWMCAPHKHLNVIERKYNHHHRRYSQHMRSHSLLQFRVTLLIPSLLEPISNPALYHTSALRKWLFLCVCRKTISILN